MLVASAAFDSSSACAVSRLALAIKIIPTDFITRLNTGHDKGTQCAHGGCRRAHSGRGEESLREGNSNPAGKAESLSATRTKRRPRATRQANERAAPGRRQPTLPALATHFERWRGRRARPGRKACLASRNRRVS